MYSTQSLANPHPEAQHAEPAHRPCSGHYSIRYVARADERPSFPASACLPNAHGWVFGRRAERKSLPDKGQHRLPSGHIDCQDGRKAHVDVIVYVKQPSFDMDPKAERLRALLAAEIE